MADGVAFPNGMAVTPDNSTLIVAESYGQPAHRLRHRRRRRPVEPAGVGRPRRRRPDGICLDAEGAVWYADVRNQRCVRVREGGEVLQTIDLDRGCFACMLGGPDRRTLFMWRPSGAASRTWARGANGQVVTAEAPAPGAGWP